MDLLTCSSEECVVAFSQDLVQKESDGEGDWEEED